MGPLAPPNGGCFLGIRALLYIALKGYHISMRKAYKPNAAMAASTAAIFIFSASIILPCKTSAAGAAYQALSSQAKAAKVPEPAGPRPAEPAGAKANKMLFAREAAIIAMSDAQFAAASPDQKVDMLKTLIGRSAPNQQNGDGGPDRDQEDLEQAIIRILASAPDAASFDRVYYRLDLRKLNSAVTAQSRIKELVERARNSVVPGDWDGLRRYVDTVTETSHSGRNLVKFLIDGREFLPEVKPALKAANSSIHIEIFHLQPDNVSRDLANILVERAKAGVTVRFLIDEHGSKVEHDPEIVKLIDLMRAGGIEVIVKEPPSIKDHLDHRKILVMDGKVGFTGGMNIGKDYQENWHDQQTLIQGPAVAKLQEAFLERWKAAGGRIAASEALFPPLPEYQDGAVTQVVGHIGKADQNIKAMYLRAIGTAQKSIRIATPYFTDKDVVKALCRAGERGVKVQLVFPKENNIPIVQNAARSFYPRLLKAGVEIYEYKDRMAHLKVAVIDGVWATFGSSNLDARSLKNNDELNLIVTDPGVAGDIERRLFDVDITKSDRITNYKPGFMDHVAHPFGGLL